MRRRLQNFIFIALAGAFVLSACGIRGELQTPPPLWGDKNKQNNPKQEK